MMTEKILRRSEVEWVHLDADGNVIDQGVDVKEEIVDAGVS